MRKVLSWTALGTVLVLAGALASAAPSKPTARSKQKASAEAVRAGIQQKLATLKKDISKTEAQKEDVSDALAESEEAISDAIRSLRDLAAEQVATNAKLKELDAQHDKLAATIDAQKKQLAKLLKEHYLAGNEDRIKLLLSGDNPNRINRDLQMMAYVSQAQARLLDSLRSNLTAIEANQADAQNAKDELEEIAQEQREQKAKLEKEQGKRKELLTSLSKKLVAQRKEQGRLEADAQRLSALVDGLAKLIKQEQDEAVARAKAEAEAKAAARAKAQADRIAKANAAKASAGGKPSASFKVTDPIDDVEPPSVANKEKEAPPPAISLLPSVPDGSFASLKGLMRAPVSGKVLARYGAKLEGGGAAWHGMFFKAPEGTEVRAIAPGRVVTSEWMRGLGNLVVISHGNDYLSVYAFNQANLKQKGDAVKAGDVIATAGNTGGSENSGLYFELRHQGRPFDPAGWVKF